VKDEERREFFKATFNSVATGYDSPAMPYFLESARSLADFMDLGGDEHVLDVATGTGNAALALAGRLPRGRVTGIDLSDGMLAQASRKRDALGIDNVDFLEMGMESLRFPDGCFDAAVCAFGIFFVDDMEAQLRRIAAKVKEGGTIVVSTFFEGSFSPLADLFLEDLRARGVEIPDMAWTKVSTREECLALFDRAGLRAARSHYRDCGYYLKNADEWWEVVWNAGYRGLIDKLPPDEQGPFREEHLRNIGRLSSAEGIRFNVGVLFTVGTASPAVI
jgi:ubiquinone/menaquinone biosynthesis C-methylase UbiE